MAWAGLAAADSVLTVESKLLAMDSEARSKLLAERFAATPIRWPAGRMTLAEAVKRLEPGGPTRLGPGASGDASAELPAQDGPYWQAVDAVCAAFDLALLPGVRRGVPGRGYRGDDDSPIGVQSGTVELVPRDPHWPRAMTMASGALRIELPELSLVERSGRKAGDKGEKANERVLDARIALRLEPRVDAERVGSAGIAFESADDARGRAQRVELVGEQSYGNEPPASCLVRVAGGEGQAFALKGRLRLVSVEPFKIGAKGKAGDGYTIRIGELQATARLLDNNTEFNGQRFGAGLAIQYPQNAFNGEPVLRLLQGGKAQRSRNSRGTGDGQSMTRWLGFPELGEGECEIAISGQVRIGEQTLPLAVTVDLAQLPAGERPADPALNAQVASRVAWKAGTYSLQQAARLLATGGNAVLLELGADERRSAELTDFSGTFWEAVLAVCKAYDVAMLPPAVTLTDGGRGEDGNGNGNANAGSGASLEGGPLTLGPLRGRDPGRFQASGPLLVEVLDITQATTRDLGGANRRVEVGVRLRLEPRVDPALVGWGGVTWHTVAENDQGRPLTVANAPGEDPNQSTRRFVRRGGRVVGVMADSASSRPRSAMTVPIDGLPPGAVTFRLGGQLQFSLQREASCEAQLTPDEPAVALLGRKPVTLQLWTAARVEEQGMGGNTFLLMSGAGQLVQSSVQVTAPSGQQVKTNGGGGWYNNAQMWYLPVTEQGAYTAVITATEQIAEVRLPFEIPVSVPAP